LLSRAGAILALAGQKGSKLIKRTRWILAFSLAMAMAATAPAQTRPGEVVQATPSAAAVDSLNRNLALLSRNPRDANALLGAGQAALDLGDVQAANGFYTRANLVNPNLGKAKLGLAIVQIALKQPAEAAVNFDAAQALGESAQGHLAERGLAYDLTGQQAKAQRDYLAALAADPNDQQARLRYATSLGISGNVNEAESQLQPVLTGGDREAWRLRAFIFAMNGRMDDARKITQTVMPKGLADALDPYMQRLPLLTAAQKAAAAHYGEFPSNVLRLAAPDPARQPREVQVAAVKEEREPSRNSRSTRNSRTKAAPRQPKAARGAAAVATAASQPAPAVAAPATLAASVPAPPAAQPAQPPLRQPVVQPVPAAPAPAPAVPVPPPAARAPATSPAPVAAPPPAASVPASDPPAAPVPPPPPPPSLADRLSGLSVPAQERQNAAVVADMAAVARIQEQRRKATEVAAAKAKEEAEAKAKAEAARKAEAERKAKLAANPARIWVQIATGKNVDALAFDLRRLRRSYSDAISDETGWTAEWGATRRLLVGPYKKIEDARAAVSKIAKAGGDAFVWQSEAGEEIAKIGGK